jgi:phosphate transport system substrate-binding protein
MPLSPIVHEFLKYIYSREGQSDVVKDGYFPVDGTTIEKHLGILR